MGTILVVSSDAEVGKAYRSVLEGRGHHIIGTHSAIQGVERLREGGIDAVIIDHDVMASLKAVAQGIARLPDPPPFVLISRDVTAPDLSAQLGAAAFLVKPCTTDEMASAIERAMSMPGDVFDDGPTSRMVPSEARADETPRPRPRSTSAILR